MTYIFRLYIVLTMAMPPLFAQDNEIHELYTIVKNRDVFQTAVTFQRDVLNFCQTASESWRKTVELVRQKKSYYPSYSSTSSASTAPAYSAEQIENAQAGEDTCSNILSTWNRRVMMATDLYHFLALCDKMPELTKKTLTILQLPPDKALKGWQYYPELNEQLMNKRIFWLGDMPEPIVTSNQNVDSDTEEDEDSGEAIDLKVTGPALFKIEGTAYMDYKGYKKEIIKAFQRTITIESNHVAKHPESTVGWFLGQISCKTGSVVRKINRYREEGVVCNDAKIFDIFQQNIKTLWDIYSPKILMFRDFIILYDPEKPSNSQYTSKYIKEFLEVNDAQILSATQK